MSSTARSSPQRGRRGRIAPPAPRDRPRPANAGVAKVFHSLVSLSLVVTFAVLAWPARYGGPLGITVIAGESMLPTYEVGQVVITSRSGAYQPQDVVVFQPAGYEAYVVHRIIGVEPDGTFLTQGDNNDFVDPWTVPPRDPIGKVILAGPRCDAIWCNGFAIAKLTPSLMLSLGAAMVSFGVMVRLTRPGVGRHRPDPYGKERPENPIPAANFLPPQPTAPPISGDQKARRAATRS